MAGIELAVRVILRNKVCSFHLLLRVVVAPEEQRRGCVGDVCSTKCARSIFLLSLWGRAKPTASFLQVLQQCQLQVTFWSEGTVQPHTSLRTKPGLCTETAGERNSYRSSILTSAVVWHKVSHLCYHVNQREFLIICSYVLMPGKFNKDTEQLALERTQ